MAKPNYQFEKRQRDLAKKNKQEEKRRQKLASKTAGNDNAQIGTANPPNTATPGADDSASLTPEHDTKR